MKRWIPAIVVLAVASAQAQTLEGWLKSVTDAIEDESLTRNEAAMLFAECGQMDLHVVIEQEEPALEGLTEQVVKNAAESRLRAARLHDDSHPRQILEVRVRVVGTAYSTRVALGRLIDDAGHGGGGVVAVWSSIYTGTHREDYRFILGVISQSTSSPSI